MAWSAKRKAILFSTALIATSALFLVNAAASTEGFLRPLREGGLEFPKERALSRHAVALAVVVTATQENSTARVQGAIVTLLQKNETAASETTDSEGRAVFHLRRGSYDLRVEWGDLKAERHIGLGKDQRQSVIFDEEGAAHWGEKAHKDSERKRADAATLVVRVQNGTRGAMNPVEGVTVTTFRPAEDGAGGRKDVESKTTGPRGAAVLDLHRGTYVVEVVWMSQNTTSRVQVCGETKLLVTFLDGGEPSQRVDGSCHKGPHQEREPTKNRPAASEPAKRGQGNGRR